MQNRKRLNIILTLVLLGGAMFAVAAFMIPSAEELHNSRMTQTINGASMSPLEILILLEAVALMLARWFPVGIRQPVVLVAAVSTVLSGAILIVLGVRWQMVPVLAGATIALVFAAVPLLWQRAGRTGRQAPWWLALLGSAACLAPIAAGVGAAWALPLPVLPEPSGEYAVGTAVMQWTDSNRLETFTAVPDDHRTIVVQLWYPAQDSSADVERAHLFGRTKQEAQALIDATTIYFGIPGFMLQDNASASTHSVFNAAVAEQGGRFPIVLVSPALSGGRTSNTVLAEELASRGYVVVSLDHTYDTAVTFIDGQPIYTLNKVAGDDEEDRKNAQHNVELRAADLSFVLTQLGRLDRGEIAGPLVGRLDTERVGVAGHSRGGAAAMQAAQDSRVTAVVNIDGGLGDGVPPFHQPALALVSPISESENPTYVPTLDHILAHGTATNYRLTIPGMGHFSFGDVALFFPPLPSLMGSTGRTEGLRITTEITAAFFDASLRSEAGELAARLSTYGDLVVFQ